VIDLREDQAAGLRRLFRRTPPMVVALYATGRCGAAVAILTAHRLAGHTRRVLLLDEGAGDAPLAGALGLPAGTDLLGVLGAQVGPQDVLQPVPGLVGRVPVSAAAAALPLLDEERRRHLVGALHDLHRHAGLVVVHADCRTAGDPSAFVVAAPRRLLVAEASRAGATQAYQTIKQLAAAGAGSLHVAVSKARTRVDAGAFFAGLNQLVRRHVGVPLAWLGEVERDDLAAGLACDVAESSPRDGGSTFLHRLAQFGQVSEQASMNSGRQS
jgi:flagellar biosynthesis protein FlhG